MEEAIISELHPAGFELCRCERPWSLEGCGLNPELSQQQAVYSHGSKAATSCSITIKNRNKIYTGYSVSTVVARHLSMCWLADLRARCSAGTRDTRKEIFICVSGTSSCPPSSPHSFWMNVRCHCVGVWIWLIRGCAYNRLPQLAKGCPTWCWGDWEHRLRMFVRGHFYFITPLCFLQF